MLIELLQKKWPDIRNIGQEAAERGKLLGLKTDWQEERAARRSENADLDERLLKRKA